MTYACEKHQCMALIVSQLVLKIVKLNRSHISAYLKYIFDLEHNCTTKSILSRKSQPATLIVHDNSCS